MKKAIFMMVLFCICGGPSFSAKGSPQSREVHDIEGIWQGALTVNGGIQLRLVLHVSKNADGSYAATLDSIDQGAKGLPIDVIRFDRPDLNLGLSKIGAKYSGTLDAEGQKFVGQWTQGPMTLPLTLSRADSMPVLNRPQEPKRPFPYEEREVTYKNVTDGVTLAGTLTLPKTTAPVPAVLLITGSGPQDRDESLMGHKPFLVLADYLTRRGIAVLRVDDRGVGGSSKGKPTDTSENFAGDALAAVEFLKAQPEIDAKHIGLIGHSEGGLIAPLAAVKSKDVAFIVLMAGPGVPGDVLIARQSALIAKAMGVHRELDKLQADAMQLYDIIKQEKDNVTAEKRIHALWEEQLTQLDAWDRKIVENMAGARDASIKMMLTPWFRNFLTYDPRTTLVQVRCPVLAINGDRDLQVPSKQNLPAIEAVLAHAGDKDFTIKELPGLNHLFQAARTGAPIEYSVIEETINPSALEIMGDWIVSHAK